MKLFVWKDVLRDYTSGMMFAVAHDLEEAKAELLRQLSDYEDYDIRADLAKEVQVIDLEGRTEPVAFYIWGGG